MELWFYFKFSTARVVRCGLAAAVFLKKKNVNKKANDLEIMQDDGQWKMIF